MAQDYTCKVIQSSDGQHYSLDGPNGTEGEAFEYGTLATVTDEDDIYYCQMNSAQDTPHVFRIVASEPVPVVVEDADFNFGDDDDEDESGDESEEDMEVAN